MRLTELIDKTVRFKYLNPNMKGGLARRGSKNQVRELQTWLNSQGYNTGRPDGIYGNGTARAVRKFQTDAGIKVDGDAGAQTIKAMMTNAHKKKPTLELPPKIILDKPLEPVEKKAVIKKKPEEVDKPPLGSTEQKIQLVLDFIAYPESRGKYDAIYPNKKKSSILKMNLETLYKDMYKRGKKYKSSASGKYQYIRKTLKGLANNMGLDPETTVFNPETQDKIVTYHLKTEHGLDKWLAGKMDSEEFLRRLSMTWAGLPDPATGKSFWSNVLNNKSGISVDKAINTLDKIQSGEIA